METTNPLALPLKGAMQAQDPTEFPLSFYRTKDGGLLSLADYAYISPTGTVVLESGKEVKIPAEDAAFLASRAKGKSQILRIRREHREKVAEQVAAAELKDGEDDEAEEFDGRD